MMKNFPKRALSAVFFIASAFALSCTKITPSGIEATTVRTFDKDYSIIEIIGPFAVESSALNPAGQIVITSDSNLLPEIETFCIGETLVIRYKKHTKWKGDVNKSEIILPLNSNVRTVKVADTGIYKCLSPISLGGHFDVVVSNASEVKLKNVSAKSVKISLSGASVFSAELSAVNSSVSLSGASSMNVSGRVSSCNATLSGASVLNGRDRADRLTFTVDKLSATMSGASLAYLSSDGEISGELSGASIVYYQGSARTDNVSLSGGASVQTYR